MQKKKAIFFLFYSKIILYCHCSNSFLVHNLVQIYEKSPKIANYFSKIYIFATDLEK